MQKQSFTVHKGSDASGDMMFLEVSFLLHFRLYSIKIFFRIRFATMQLYCAALAAPLLNVYGMNVW